MPARTRRTASDPTSRWPAFAEAPTTIASAREFGISITFIAARGDAYREIKRIADETRADAIVVGASAKAGHKLVGSLAVRLVRAGKWPVTVVP